MISELGSKASWIASDLLFVCYLVNISFSIRAITSVLLPYNFAVIAVFTDLLKENLRF